MKIFGFAPNGKMLKIGDNEKTALWYWITETTSMPKDLQKGDEVIITFEKRGGGNYLKTLSKGDSPVVEVEKTEKVTVSAVEDKLPEAPVIVDKPTHITSEVLSSIDKINDYVAIGKMTSETLIALQGHVKPENVDSLIDKIFNKYKSKVENG